MRTLIHRLVDGYRSYHASNKSLLEWIGVVGAIGFPLLYAMRFTGKLPPLYDDLPFRAVATLSCLLTALRRWWPARAQPYYDAFSYWTVFYSLAFMLPFTLLHNRVATPTVVNMVVSVVFVVLLTDWRNTIAILVAGYASALGAYWLTADQPRLPVEFLLWWMPVCAVLVAAGSIGKHIEKQAELARMRRLYAGLAGSIAHEVRSPLLQVNYVLDAIDAALADRKPGAAGFAHERLAAVREAVEQGRSAVSRGLQAISVTLQQLNPSAFDPSKFRLLSAAQCVRRAAAEYAYDNESQRGRVVVRESGDFLFRGEETAFVLILFNLVKNALYYLPVRPDAVVTITVDGAARRVVVHDTGPGIAPELLPRLFEEFRSVGKAEGTGLGLAYCKRAMQAFGGGISCRSERGQFTEFVLDFPEAPEAEKASAGHGGAVAPAPGPGALAGRTVLVVDDQALNRAAARAQLAALGARVMEAGHGQQAFELLRDGAVPDAILMDVNMPGMSGLDTTRAMRALPAPAANVPVIAVTANVSPGMLDGARAAGMQEILSKPVDRQRLMEVLGPLLAGATPAPAAPLPTDIGDELLETSRIDGLRQLGLLDELMPGMLGEIRRLAGVVRDSVANGDSRQAQEALHTLVGLSGETGAQAVHVHAKGQYRSMLDHGQPIGREWLDQLHALLASTEQAVLLQYGLRAAPAQTSSHSLRV